jgi:hypothetical protein
MNEWDPNDLLRNSIQKSTELSIAELRDGVMNVFHNHLTQSQLEGLYPRNLNRESFGDAVLSIFKNRQGRRR